MPLLFLPIILAALLFVSPSSILPSLSVVKTPQEVVQLSLVEMHYTKNGIVQINSQTGATRFTPYRLAPEMDRRSFSRG